VFVVADPLQIRAARGGRAALIVALLLALCAAALPAGASAQPGVTPTDDPVASGATFRIYGYDEGLVGGTTSNGHVIVPNDHFVALPCFCVLSSQGGNEFEVKLEYKGRTVIAPVWDVGPWNTDDNYWDAPAEREWEGLPQGMPAAQAAFETGYNGGKDGKGRTVTSPGGIDIGDGTFADLGMTGSDWLTVTFLWVQPQRFELPPLPGNFGDIPTVWTDERPPLDPAAAITDGRFGYFSETGHNVPNDILTFWQNNGALPTFGYPISEFYRQPQPDGTLRFMQYFERAVIAIDLSGSTDPPLVTADLLGYNSYIEPAAQEQVEPFTSDDVCTYFPETGHALCNGFRNYWQAHGGLVAFGYPISEEWGADSDGEPVVVQIFERARFEWWPNQVGTDAEYTLGLLGVEQLQRQGWLEAE
jgi:hypothetical protein